MRGTLKLAILPLLICSLLAVQKRIPPESPNKLIPQVTGPAPGPRARHADGSSPLRVIGSIPLPGVQGRIDHMALDARGRRLFVAALGNNTLEVIDLVKNERVRSIRGLREPQGVRYLPEQNAVVVANGADGVATFFEASLWRPLVSI